MAEPVSVVIPTYNRYPLVRESIDSALAQPEVHEVIVVDDASMDGTVERLTRDYDGCERLRMLRQPENRDKSAARNRGLAAATTPFIMFLDSDDVLESGAVGALLEVMLRCEGEEDVVVYGPCRVHDRIEIPFCELPGGKVLSEYIRRPFLHTPSFLAPVRLLSEVGGYREDLSNMEDVELFLRLMCRARFFPVDHVVFTIRKQADATSSNYARILQQGRRLFEYIRGNEDLMRELSGDDRCLLESRI
ncbi:MAG: glycosyltransferase family 2 protein, partial [Lentisphaerae bacterium]